MKEKTTIADQYLFKNFYQTCTEQSKKTINCRGIELCEDYSWMDVILDGEKTCTECEFSAERQGFYFGKNEFSANFEKQEFVTLEKIRTQEEFEKVCERISAVVKGIVVRGAVSDASPLERFELLEFVVFEGQRITRFWDTSKTPNLRMLTIWMNKNLKSLSGLENASNMECLQFYTSFSDVAVHKIESFSPISKLSNLKELIVSAIESLDHNIDYLIELPTRVESPIRIIFFICSPTHIRPTVTASIAGPFVFFNFLTMLISVSQPVYLHLVFVNSGERHIPSVAVIINAYLQPMMSFR